MTEIRLWDMQEDIGYVDECDVKIVQMLCNQDKEKVILWQEKKSVY